jgi:hypothetical protein
VKRNQGATTDEQPVEHLPRSDERRLNDGLARKFGFRTRRAGHCQQTIRGPLVTLPLVTASLTAGRDRLPPTHARARGPR